MSTAARVAATAAAARIVVSIIAIIILSILTTPVARADISAAWVPVPITATTDDSGVNIAGYQCWDLTVTLTPGDDFLSGRIFIDPPGTIFQHPLGQGAGVNYAPPNPAVVALFPALEFDTYLQGPGGGLIVLGLTDGINDLPGPGIFNEDKIAVQVGDLINISQGGTYRLMRLTFNGPIPPVLGTVYSLEDPQIGVPLPSPVPEPAVATIAAGVGLMLLRRSR